MPKDNKNNRMYTEEQREAMVSKLLPPNNMSITELLAQSGLPQTTLHGWKTRALKKYNPKNGKVSKNTTSSKKFHIVMETYTLSEYDLAKYCRKRLSSLPV
jgi:transposase